MIEQKNFCMKELIKNLSDKELLKIGVEEYAYVRPVTFDDQEVFAIHAADGTPLSISESYDQALSTIQEQELKAVTIH